MSSISTHVLDLVRGGPAAGVGVVLERWDGTGWLRLAEGETDANGRIAELVPRGAAVSGMLRISFATGPWFAAREIEGFYPYVPVVFEIPEGTGHYHVPLLLGPYGYSTYRGS